ncbi:hypothetical protein GQ55_2G154200 [Panicum hallii var. hallii]|uniref:Uncharacterized protein n=1 Tax=Panicum hallii var. hallii TaxID=1504633 RepID=A0A2T7EPU8_9POAL|nr:hypothetical protein GQ55_2G154200 [Panicum hallii var. hallii]
MRHIAIFFFPVTEPFAVARAVRAGRRASVRAIRAGRRAPVRVRAVRACARAAVRSSPAAFRPSADPSRPCPRRPCVGLRGRPLVDSRRPPVRGSACRGRPVLLPIAASSPCSWCSPRH